MFSSFLNKRKDKCKEIVDLLGKEYPYVSIFAKHAKGKRLIVDSKITQVGESTSLMETEAGFVIKVFNADHYSEYSIDDVEDFDIDVFKKAIALDNLHQDHINVDILSDEPLQKDFERLDPNVLTDDEIVKKLDSFKDYFSSYDQRIVNVTCVFIKRESSSMFITKNRELTQYYTWNNCLASLIVSNGEKIKDNYDGTNGHDSLKVLDDFDMLKEDFAKISVALLDATTIEPGVYDVITAPSISGLIAHEAFGHGVEMDMFVKNRAKAKDYIGKRVASEVVSMHDGAAATLSAASYFFDDDGVLAHDTEIISNGIIVDGSSDVLTALELKKEPTGNSRRESTRRKAYTRMTNTFFLPGTSKKEEMIASIKHGYYLSNTNNGMEDPKNWNIQCTAQYGLEIKDGKFTGKIVSPVVMSGNVLDVLNSISMVSDEYKIIGAGQCGKGHKEWVFVADGGPYMKARVKLG